jgi:hypothetical protein
MIIARFQESFSQKSPQLDYLAFWLSNMHATFRTVKVMQWLVKLKRHRFDLLSLIFLVITVQPFNFI